MCENVYELKNKMVLTDEMQINLFTKLLSLTPHCNINFPPNDIGLGNLFAECFRDTLRFCVDNQQWYCYDDGVWVLDKGEIRTQRNMQILLQLLHLYCTEVTTDENEDEIRKYRQYINKSSSDVILRRGINASKNMLIIELTDFDKDPYLLNCTNGVYDLRTGKIIPNSPELYLTKKTNTYPLNAVTKKCDRWYQFIDEIMSHDKEKVAFLQRALGFSILGVNREECMFIAYGAKSRNGKGTLFSTLSAVLSSGYMGSVDTDLICVDKRGKVKDFNAPQPALRKIVGTRIVTMSENDRDVLLASASMKAITGRDELTTRGLYEAPITFTPQFNMWLLTNYLPAVTDDTIFKSNRVWVLEFNEHFGNENRDNDLKDYFAQPKNLPTVLKWLMDGCVDYLKNGLNPPESVIKATQNYKEQCDRILMFLKDCCTFGDDKKVLRSSLYFAYERWCRKPENKFNPIGSQKFYKELAIRDFLITKTTGEYYVKGLDLINNTTNSINLL